MPKKSELRVLPHNLEAEQSVLGALMLDKEAIVRIADILQKQDFYKDAHGIIYESMLELYEEREPIDVLSVSNKLEEKKILDTIGGSGYLASLVSQTPSAQNILHYARLTQKKATLRRLIHVSNEIGELGYQEAKNLQDILDKAEQKLFQISQKYIKKDFIPIKSVLEEAFNRIDELHKGGNDLRGIPSGFSDIDNILAGFQKSDLIILAARPSIGKTTLALDLARFIGKNAKIPVGIFSLEMSADQLVDRMIAAEAGIDLWKLRTGKLRSGPESDDFQKIGVAMGVLSEAPIFIDDASSANIMQLRTLARRLQAQHKLGIIIIDYLQLMEGRSKENRVQEISEISRGLKNLAKELNIPILALSQLSRAVESRTDQIPKLSDLRESGSIEQDADVVLFLYREDRIKTDSPNKNIVEVIVAKHRNGPLGKVPLFFDEASTTFRQLERLRTQ